MAITYTYKRIVFFALLASVFFAGIGSVCGQAFAAEAAPAKTPLLMEGKKTLYQRVISHPGAVKYSEAAISAKGAALKPFTVLYVYSRKQEGDKQWVEVSPSSNGTDIFWLPEETTAAWKQALTLVFTERMGRAPVLFFKDAKGLQAVCESAEVGPSVKKLIEQFTELAKKNEAPADFPLIGMEPTDEQGAVANKRFYIMPIFDWQDPYEGVKLLQVASIDPGNFEQTPAADAGAAGGAGGAGAGGAGEAKIEPLRTGIVFVIDTTISMKPYIDKSLQVARTIYDMVEKEGVSDKVGLAVVAFRSSTKARSNVDYLAKVVSPFKDATQRKEFESALGSVKEATASTHDYNEDSYAGLAMAVEDLDWSKYHSRLVLLITDAGPLQATDPYASVKMRGQELGDVLKAHNISVVVAHVQTPEGAKNHKYAEAEYSSLYANDDKKQAGYVPIPASTPALASTAFDAFASSMGKAFVTIIKNADGGPPPAKPAEKAPDNPADKGKWLAETLGYSMQLDYLGEKRGNRAPAVVSSWIADMDLGRLAESRRTESVDVAVLLTKGQLSALQKQLSLVIEKAEGTKLTGSKDFFQSILSASAQMSRDPGQFASAPGKNLQSLGVLGEFLDDLPYKSQILQMTEDDWNNMNLGQQTQFINRLKSRIARYVEYEKDRDNWESFGASDSNDWVYRVPLSMLP